MGKSQKPKIHVVYVEDEPSIAQLLVSGLGLFGIVVHPVFMSAEALLERTDRDEFQRADLFFFDIRLPRMTGLDLARELRARGEQRPFVLVSAWPSPPKNELEAIHARFLPKPFDFPDVVQTIQDLMEN
ncbi:MAG: response regulator [Chloroflexi bacterium]|nr:response regulator [Chloroflexota bacterium]MBK6708931.1 response regulator [Chloroflexota bacterium]MBK7175904.1 response regulator [Chloroflexota bacterium]MBP7590016.1 response regulator [Chloroflexota bacterium]